MSRPPLNGSPKHSGEASRHSRAATVKYDGQHGDGHTIGRDGPKGRSTPPLGVHPNQLEDKEELRMRELEEARARAAQMEKTMRWWSDCTANWREKWGKVRAERNKAREEVRQLRIKLEAIAKESTALKRDKQEVLGENERLKKALEREQARNSLHLIVGEDDDDNPNYLPEKDTNGDSRLPGGDFIESVMQKGQTKVGLSSEHPQENGSDPAAATNSANPSSDRMHTARSPPYGSPVRKPVVDTQDGLAARSDASGSAVKSRNRKTKEVPSPSDEMASQRMLMLELRMEEATKTIQVEREEKDTLGQQIDRLQKELSTLRNQQDELRDAKQHVVKELNLMRADHQRELVRVTSDLDEELNSRSDLDIRISDMRKELERLQAENAMEWGKRERLETEKLSQERDNKKLKAEIADLKEHLAKKNKLVAADLMMNVHSMESNLQEKNKELSELKHNQAKLKKLAQEKTAELDHTMRRADQHEGDVKKLRGRVDELKRELAKAEDEVDQQCNMVRKLQRNLDENQQSNENLAVQVEHLQARLRNAPTVSSTLAKKRAASFSFSSGNLSLQDNGEREITSDIDI